MFAPVGWNIRGQKLQATGQTPYIARCVLFVSWAAVTRHDRLHGLNNPHRFPIVLEPGSLRRGGAEAGSSWGLCLWGAATIFSQDPTVPESPFKKTPPANIAASGGLGGEDFDTWIWGQACLRPQPSRHRILALERRVTHIFRNERLGSSRVS